MTLASYVLEERLKHQWEPEWITYDLHLARRDTREEDLLVESGQGDDVEYGIRVREFHPEGTVSQAILSIHTGLRPLERKTFVVRHAPGQRRKASAPVRLRETPGFAVIESDCLEVRVPVSTESPGKTIPPPILGIRLPGQDWLLPSRFEDLPEVSKIQAGPVEGPAHLVRYRVAYRFVGGETCSFLLELSAHESVVVVEEEFTEIARGRMILDLYAGLEPDRANWTLHRSSPGKESPEHTLRFDAPSIYRIQPFWSWYLDEAAWWGGFRKGGERYLAILASEPTRWTNPLSNQIIVRGNPGPVLEAEFPFRLGTRKWLLLLENLKNVPESPEGKIGIVHHAMISHGENSLNRVKDMGLVWDHSQDVVHPRILCKAGDVPAIREKAWTNPEFKRLLENHPERPKDPAGLYLATGDENDALKAKREILAFLEQKVKALLTGGYTQGDNVAIGFSRPVRDTALACDFTIRSPVFSMEERRFCMAAFAFIASCMSDRNLWPEETQGFPRGNVNFHSDWFSALAVVCALIPEHPRYREWMLWCENEMNTELDRNVSPGGAWGEAPNYQGFTLHYLLAACIALRECGFRDFTGDPRFRETMNFLSEIQTPKDPRLGRSMLPTLGDTTTSYHSQSLQTLFAWVASVNRDDPLFSGKMMDAWRRAGGMIVGKHNIGLGTGWGYPLTLIDPSIPSISPEESPVSRRFPGFGALLRSGPRNGRETHFLYKCGAAGGHYDADEGSWHWYCKGVPLSYDFGSMYSPCIDQPWYHNTLSFGRQRIWNSGEIPVFLTFPGSDFLSSVFTVTNLQRVTENPGDPALPPGENEIRRHVTWISWRRDVLFVKGPDFLVVRDTVRDRGLRQSTDWSMQVMANRAELDGSRAFFEGQFDIDLAVFFAEPENPGLKLTRWGYKPHEEEKWVMDPPPLEVSETQMGLHAHAETDTDYLAVLFPFPRGTERPEIRSVARHVLKARYDGGEDLIFLAPHDISENVESVKWNGRAGYVRKEEGKTTVCLLEGQGVEVPEMAIWAPGPFWLEISPLHIKGESDGSARSFFLRWFSPQGDPTVLIDGKPVHGQYTYDGHLLFNLPEGKHWFEVFYTPSQTVWEF